MWIIPKNLTIYPLAQDMEALTSDLEELACQSTQSLMWRSKLSPSQIWLKRWKTVGWMSHLYGRILKPSHTQIFTEKLTSLAEDSHVNHLVKQDIEEDQMTLDTSSHTSSEESENLEDLPLFSLKMLKESSQQKSTGKVYSNMSSQNWKAWVMNANREFLARRKKAVHISEKEFSLSVQDSIKKEKISSDLFLKEIKPDLNLLQDKVKNNIQSNRLDSSQKEDVYLNPRWVEMLMGIPIGWTSPNCTQIVHIEKTNLNYSEMESSPIPVLERSKSFGRNWSTPVTKYAHENLDKLINKDGSKWDGFQTPHRNNKTRNAITENLFFLVKKEKYIELGIYKRNILKGNLF